LDEVLGEKRVEIHWPSDDEVDVDLLRLYLISEIDAHRQRIPLDLRGVHGSPERLVDLLIEMQRYAASRSKVLSISASLPAMQEALNPRRRRKAGRPQDAIDETGARTASEVARSAIKSQPQAPNALLAQNADVAAERRVRSGTRRSAKRVRRIIELASMVLIGVAAISSIYWFSTRKTPPLVYSSVKSFESSAAEKRSETNDPANQALGEN
jgi:hypothetical protein